MYESTFMFAVQNQINYFSAFIYFGLNIIWYRHLITATANVS